MALAYEKRVRILTNAIVGGPIPENETAEEKSWRESCEADVKAAADQGYVLDIPSDWENNEPSMQA